MPSFSYLNASFQLLGMTFRVQKELGSAFKFCELGFSGIDALLEALLHGRVPGGSHGGLGVGDLLAVLGSFRIQLFENSGVDSRCSCFCRGFRFSFCFRLSFSGESCFFSSFGLGLCLSSYFCLSSKSGLLRSFCFCGSSAVKNSLRYRAPETTVKNRSFCR